MLVTVQSVVGSPGVSTLAVALAAHLEAVVWDCDPAGSSLAAWAGRKPAMKHKVRLEPGWYSLDRDWMKGTPDPPINEHLSNLGNDVHLLASEIATDRRSPDERRFAHWAHTRSRRTVVADRGRQQGVIPADHHVIVVRATLEALWRTFVPMVEAYPEETKRATWAVLKVPGRDDSGVVSDVKLLKSSWGIAKSIFIPWDPRTAAKIGRGQTVRSGPMWKRSKALAELIRSDFS